MIEEIYTKNDIKYSNNFGFIKDDKIEINSYNRILSISIKHIRKVFLLKTRVLYWNFLFLFFSFSFLSLLFTFNMSFIFQLFIYFLILSAFIISLLFRSYQYKFVMLKKYDFMELIINKSSIDDVKKFVSNFNITNR